MKTTNVKKKSNLVLCVLAFLAGNLYVSCNDNLSISEVTSSTKNLTIKAVPTPALDWENLDWMPTPSGQQIPSPWIGQGSLSSLYGIDVVNDRLASDGWVLVYNTFSTTAPSPLINPYFVLYNKYRGILRFYLYITTQFISPSSYVQDAISIVTNSSTTMLNLTGNSIIDASQNRKIYAQIQPAPIDGSLPLASNKWYMMQYEMGYDPNLPQIPYNQIQLSWAVNYCNVQTINLGGEIVGTIKGTVGSSSNSNAFSALGNLGSVVGTGVVAGIGSQFIDNNQIDANGANKLGLPKNIFNATKKGIQSAISGTVGKVPGAIINVFSSILGGASSPTTMVNLNIQADIKLQGTGSSSGSFPSSPISFWVPGTTLPGTAIGYIPLYQNILGVLNFNGKPNIPISGVNYIVGEIGGGDISTSIYFDKFPSSINFSNYLLFNPEVKDIANITVKKQELIAIILDKSIYSKCERIEKFGDYDCLVNPTYMALNGYYTMPENAVEWAVRFTINIVPKNGVPPCTITKTFKLNPTYSLEVQYDVFSMDSK